MNYTKDQIKEILNKELFNKNYDFNYEKEQPANCLLVKNIREYFNENYPDLFKCGAEILYCYKYKNNFDSV